MKRFRSIGDLIAIALAIPYYVVPVIGFGYAIWLGLGGSPGALGIAFLLVVAVGAIWLLRY